ncbi:MAG: P-loop NTPase [Candidatus Hadarchaeota archaeon]
MSRWRGDPRLETAEKRLAEAGRLIAVVSGKGGVGKSVISAASALALSKLGYRVGLFDLDFHGPSAHVVLGAGKASPKEEKGVVPPLVHGVRLMSLVYYTGDRPSPLRGAEVSNAMLEMLAITRWGPLDFLIVDMPPGTGDEVLDLLRVMKRAEFLVVTSQSKMAWETVRKLLYFLKELKVPVLGVVENMRRDGSAFIKKQAEKLGMPFLGSIDFDRMLEDSIGNSEKLLKTDFSSHLEKILNRSLRGGSHD